MFTKESFLSFYKGQPNEQAAADCFDYIYTALKIVGIYTDLTLIGALATARVEVGRAFLPVIENTFFALRYEFRNDLGNTAWGDGVKYRGRGYIQLTGKNNYINYAQELDIDLVNNPDLALKPNVAALILAQYFKDKSVATACNAQNWVLVRELVNGGTNGLNTFINILNQYLIKVVPDNINLNATNNMELGHKLEITKIEVVGDKTIVSWHRFDSMDNDHNSSGTWEFDGVMDDNAVAAKAKTMVDSDIIVSLNLQA
jgi:hypothetical protein